MKVFIKNFFIIILFLFLTQNVLAYRNQGLRPENFNELYELADDGNLMAIKYAMARGLNLEAKNQYGDTALCHAITKGDYRAYNTLYAAGANPKPPCVFTLEKSKYARFMNSGFATPIRQTTGYQIEDVSSNWLDVPVNEEEAEFQAQERLKRQKEAEGSFFYWLKKLNPLVWLNPFNWF